MLHNGLWDGRMEKDPWILMALLGILTRVDITNAQDSPGLSPSAGMMNGTRQGRVVTTER